MRLKTVGLILTFTIGLVAAPLTTNAEKPGKVYRIGWLTAKKSDFKNHRFFKAFMEEFHDLGWVEGKNFVTEFRSAEADFERLPALAAELVRLKVDVIITLHTTDTHAAKNATTSIPIVFTVVSDPLGEGFIRSHARPGGNITGTNPGYIEIMGKTLQLLTEAVPEASRVAYLWNPGYGKVALRALEKMQAAAKILEVKLQSLEVRDPQDFEPAFSAMAREHADALFVMPGPLTNSNSKRIADSALANRLPLATNGGRPWAVNGALFSYAPMVTPLFRRAAHYVDRILKGADPAELPVEKPTHFDFVINLKTASALGLTIPQSLHIQATEVIDKSVLVMERNLWGNNWRIVWDYLWRTGFGTYMRPITGGEDAVDLARLHRPDLILMEIYLDGYDTIRRIKATPALTQIPLIAITDDDVKASEAGCDGYMMKPNLVKMSGKVIEVLKEAVPDVYLVGFLWRLSDGEVARRFLEEMEPAGKTLGVKIQSVAVKDLNDFEPAFSEMIKDGAQAVISLSSLMTDAQAPQVGKLALKNGLPLMCIGGGRWQQSDALMSYGIHYPPLLARAAEHVVKILKGTEPANLADKEPTPFEFVVNLKTAKELGVTIPQSVVSRANKVIK